MRLNHFWPLFRSWGWICFGLCSDDGVTWFWLLFRWWGNLVLASVQIAWPTHVILAFALIMRLHYFRPLFRRRGRIVFWTSLRCNHILLPRFQCDRPNRNRPAPYTVCKVNRKKICPLSKDICRLATGGLHFSDESGWGRTKCRYWKKYSLHQWWNCGGYGSPSKEAEQVLISVRPLIRAWPLSWWERAEVHWRSRLVAPS